MFVKTRSNSVGAIPKDVTVSQIPDQTEDRTQTQEIEKNSQGVQIPSTKRKRIETSPTQIENAKKKVNNLSYAVPTHNQFNILDDATEDIPSQPTEREAKPPPIFIDKTLFATYRPKPWQKSSLLNLKDPK
ncbi:Uncharacterized protein OBRU01_09791 [Operophtera brumata]|uniref:Uncharacterized protein n=1 Tax=Operophtera brumata TaxID=104452 RepID=A0A0L7LFI6_OPEBR|nr:Uncharacterized protein OBRU01_09791 [Operophtera brumata]